MTKKDYELIAKSFSLKVTPLTEWAVHEYKLNGNNLAFARYKEELNAIMAVAYNLAVKLKQQNNRFDKDKFFEACGFGNESILPQ